jgi:hypothetical protein
MWPTVERGHLDPQLKVRCRLVKPLLVCKIVLGQAEPVATASAEGVGTVGGGRESGFRNAHSLKT